MASRRKIEPKISWYERVERASYINIEGKQNGFTDEDKQLADSFRSCAISERPALKRAEEGLGHEDNEDYETEWQLSNALGMAFGMAVLANDTSAAHYLLEAMDAAEELLKEKK